MAGSQARAAPLPRAHGTGRGRDRDELSTSSPSAAIGTGVHYRGVHLHPYYRERYGIAPEALPVASAMSDRTLSLPLSPALDERDLERVCAALRAAVGGAGLEPATPCL